MHGTADRVIPIEQSYEYERAARALGKQVTTLYVEGGGHMVSVGFGSDVARQKAIDYLIAELMR
jgi:dipeptidyl aminopeptidase/acylaminoacyl peptidase